jgi:hypothetical protein
MKKHFFPALSLLCILASCKKEPGSTERPSETQKLNIDLAYSQNDADISAFELIISDNDGNVLLDTIGAVKTKIVTELATKTKLVNVTVIARQNSPLHYTARTFIGVNPEKWDLITNDIYYNSPIYFPPSTPATLHYINAPSGSPLFTNSPAPVQNTITTGAGTIDVSYSRAAGGYTYLMMPSLDLYKLYVPAGDADTVDLIQMDTALHCNFNIPSSYQTLLTELDAYVDTTDIRKYLNIYSSPFMYPGFDLIYPKKSSAFQKYEFWGIWSNQNSASISYYSYEDSVPTAASFFSESDYVIHSSQADNFNVEFPTLEPSLCRIDCSADNLDWRIYSSPNSALQPLTLLTSLHSVYLKNEDLTKLKITGFNFEKADGFPYDNYFNYVFNPDLMNKKLLRRSVAFGKGF